MGFKVKYRGMLRELEDVINGVAFLDGDEAASPRDIQHPDYHPTLGLTAAHSAALNDEPEPALPRTDGGEPDEEVTEEHEHMGLISQAAAAHLQRSRQQTHAAKQALRDFTPMEQRALIDEGAGRLRARNLANLNLDGTHYDPAALDEDPEDLGFGW